MQKWSKDCCHLVFVYTDIVEDAHGRVYIFEAHEGALACNDPAFLKLGGCGVAVHAVSPQLLEGLRASERTARACVLPVDTCIALIVQR